MAAHAPEPIDPDVDTAEEQRRLRAVYVRVLLVQAAALILLWLLEASFSS